MYLEYIYSHVMKIIKYFLEKNIFVAQFKNIYLLMNIHPCPGWRMGRNIRNNICDGGTEGYRHCELFTLHAGPGKYAQGENNNHSLS